ncbi:hypothetical protein PLANPX_3027 [Lacipirellula parvula]|uniref:Uncharacterized protein n=2 Tax=Lacipirellula parvula TaxID=2650471 RepID=A0A5K7XAG4_9BACT|nr:hypothetical protein PLANPX_3027 [Lacipirellula parvula]
MMTRFVLNGIGNVGVREKPIPLLESHDAITRTTAALICMSDIRTVVGDIGNRQGLTLGKCVAVNAIPPTCAAIGNAATAKRCRSADKCLAVSF